MSRGRKTNRGNPARVGVVADHGMHFTADRARPGLLDRAVPGVHLWIANATHVISEASAARSYAPDGEPVLLDAETIALFTVGCWVCEEPYTPELASRPCPGEPTPQGARP